MKNSTRTLLGATALALVVPLTALAGPASAARTTHSQDADIAITDDVTYDSAASVDSITIPDSGPADPNPSQITVDLEPGKILDVDVILGGIDHGSAEDLDILLVGPGGQQATIMSDAGGPNMLVDNSMYFDDEAPNQLPTDNPNPGWYQPTNLGGAEVAAQGIDYFNNPQTRSFVITLGINR